MCQSHLTFCLEFIFLMANEEIIADGAAANKVSQSLGISLWVKTERAVM